MADNTFRETGIYKDINLSFTKHPLTNDIGVKTDREAIKQAVQTLVLTNFYERPFHPEIGGNVRALLFEQASPITTNNIKDAIRETLFNHEPRVEVIDIDVNDASDRNAYDVRLVFNINSVPDPVSLDLVLTRLR